MKLHEWYTLGWAFWIVGFVAWEIVALTNRADQLQPFTWYVRRIVGTWTSPVWYMTAGFLVWLIVHFLFVHK